LQGVTATVLGYRNQARHAVAFFVLTANQAAGSLRGDQDDIEVGARLDLLVVNIEAVCEQYRSTLVELIDDRCIEVTIDA
jgi:hypothetical protein